MFRIPKSIVSWMLQLPLMAAVVFFDFKNIIHPWTILSVWVLFLIYPLLLWVVIWYKKNTFERDSRELVAFLLTFILSVLPGVIVGGVFLLFAPDQNNILLRVTGKVAFFYLALCLMVSPLNAFTHSRYTEGLLRLRRALGVLSFLFFLKHGLDYFILEHFYYTSYYTSIYSFLGYLWHNIVGRADVAIGLVAGAWMLALGITSNAFSYRMLGKVWKSLHTLVYPIFLLSLLHIAFAGRFDGFYASLLILVASTRFASLIIERSKKDIITSGRTTKYICLVCGFIYDEAKWDPDSGILPWTKWEDIPDSWYCPLCKVGKKDFEPYYEKTSETDDSLSWAIVAIERLTSDVIELSIDVPSCPKVIPGQFFRFALEDFDGKFYRSYSVAWIKETKYTFLIKMKSDGRAGRLWKNIKVGETLSIENVSGLFTLQNTSRPKVFIATGTGLAPVYHMIMAASSEARKEIHFWVRSVDDVFYKGKLESIPALSTKIYLSKEQKEGYLHGRIDPSAIEASLDTEFYICGSPVMTEEAVAILKNRGFTNIYFESFS